LVPGERLALSSARHGFRKTRQNLLRTFVNSCADRKTPRQVGRHAIVIGGSLAGMLAARVLTDHYDEVTIVESDRYPGGVTSRSGVPQSKHVHVLMLRGQAVLEKLFPGIRADLTAADAQLVDVAGEVEWLTRAGWGLRFPSSLVMIACTRDLLDWHVRLRLAVHPRARFIEATEVSGLLPKKRGSGVAGVRLRDRCPQATNVINELYGDLVVDASGRGSKLPHWLSDVGYEAPAEERINGFLGYASRIYAGRSADQPGKKIIFVQAAPPDVTRGGLVQPIEKNRFLVTLIGMGRDYPPVDEVDFQEFARSLRSPLVYEFVRDAQPLTPIACARHTENRWRHFERLERWPNGLVVLGDAACAFNPVYAQGMTTAALGAETLSQCLDAYSPGFEKKFQKELARVIEAPWLLATSEDFRVRGTEGGSPRLKTRLMHRYMDQVIRLTTVNRNVRLAFLKVMHMLESPSTLFRPSVLMQVVRLATGLSSRTIGRRQSTVRALNKHLELGNGVS
jgi:2-polyprenyl-6-methoxyphenol hydroxylase-like FAD-dependent oxidoreductase